MPQDEEKVDTLQTCSQRPSIEKPSSTTIHDIHDSSSPSSDGNSNSDSGSEKDDGDDEDEDDEDSADTMRLDPKEMLIVKDGTIKVAHPYREPEPQYDANGELIKASGTWTQVEHDRFLKAIQTYPKGPWKAIAAMVGSRTVRQTQTHAQKHREKMARRMRGLRNRNGTLQTPPMRLSQLVTTSPMYGQLVMPAMQYASRPLLSPHGMSHAVEYMPIPAGAVPDHIYGGSPTHAMVETPHALRPTIPSDIYFPHGYHQMHHYAASPHLGQIAHVASPSGVVTMEYEMSFKQSTHDQQHTMMVVPRHEAQQKQPQAKTPTTVATDLQPTPWSEHAPKNLVPSPDYNESMDFLMNFYAIDPNHPAAHMHLLQAQQQHYATVHGLQHHHQQNHSPNHSHSHPGSSSSP